MRRFLLAALCAAALAGCPKGSDPDAGPHDDGGPMTLKPCLDRPGELPTAPGSQLPCELLPPDFGQ
jgi:hypothetical protein